MSGRRRIVIVLGVVWCLAAVALVWTARQALDAPSTSDTAVIGTYTRLAAEGRLLLGPYSRFQWHHPGPLYFFLLVPFHLGAGGRVAGLHAGAAALSLASLFALLGIAWRHRERPLLPAGLALAVTVLVWRGAEAFASPWNPHVLVLPVLLAVVAAAEVCAGSAAALPLVAASASLAAQAHIAVVPCVVVVGAVAAIRAAVGACRDANTRVWRRSLAATAVVLGAAWVLPLYEQFTGVPRGNLTELWRFFGNRVQSGQPPAVALSAISDMLVGIVRPDFQVAHGLPFVESPVLWAEWLSLGLAAVTAVAAMFDWARARRFEALVGAFALLAAGIALWSATRIEERVYDHDLFWVSGIGALLLAVAAGQAVARVLGARAEGRLVRGLVPVATVVSVLLASAALFGGVRDVVRRSAHPPVEATTARALAEDLIRYLDAERIRRPLIRIDQDAWGIVAGAILEMQARGRLVSVEEDWVVMFTPVFRSTGTEEATITIAAPAEHQRLAAAGVPVIAAHDPVYAHVSRPSVAR